MASPETAPVFSVQHFCLHDGPGIRSLVFFKGCPLQCAWCQNPESWKGEPEIGFKARLCISCGRCAEACPVDTHARPVYRDAALCRVCFSCVDACPSGALVRLGSPRSVGELLGELSAEFPLIRESGGGVTLSGGEPTLYPDFCAALARKLRAAKIPVALETSGMFRIEAARHMIDAIELVLFDIKLFAGDAHRRYCGAGNAVIKKNLTLLAGRKKKGPKLWPRMPLVPGVTATGENIDAWASFLRRLGVRALSVVPYHRMGNDKRAWLNAPAAPEYDVPSQEETDSCIEAFRDRGLTAFLPGEEDWSAF